MNCPVCDRSLAPTLSICPSCGAMMYDTVREELQTKITSGPLPAAKVKARTEATPQPRPSIPPPPFTAPRVERRAQTGGLAASKTSPTLVEFQNKNASVPEWRLQLQNAVQQRRGGQPQAAEAGTRPQFNAHGAAALKVESAPQAECEPATGTTD